MKSRKTKRFNTWSALSSVTVNLKPSRDYQKFLLLLYGMLVFVLFQSSIYWVFRVILVFVLGVYFVYLWRLKTPGASCSKIVYSAGQWHVDVLPTRHGLSEAPIVVYQNVRIKFDIGGLMWLVFEHAVHGRHVLLFQDQMALNEHRMLRVLLRVL